MRLLLSQAAEVRLGRQRAPQYEVGDHQVRYLRSANVVDGRLDLSDVKSMNFTPAEQAIFAVEPGDVLMTEGSGSAETVGTSAVWQDQLPPPVCFQNTLLRLRPRTGVTDGRYLAWWARHAHGSGQIAAVSSGANIQHLGSDGLKRLQIDVPPLVDQRRIADFLDDRVGRIDRIIAARRDQLERLNSLFVSLVTETIDAAQGHRCPLWMMAARITDGAHVSPETEDGAFDFVSTRDISVTGSIDFEGALKTSHRSYEELVKYGCSPRPGDVLFSKDGTVGRTARVTEDREFVVASSLIIIRPDPERLDFNFLHFLCRHAEFAHQVDGYVKGAGLPRISIANLRRVSGIFPGLATQRDLARALEKQHERMVRDVQHLTASIDLLSEYKQCLITAAVTGELDVTTAGCGAPG